MALLLQNPGDYFVEDRVGAELGAGALERAGLGRSPTAIRAISPPASASASRSRSSPTAPRSRPCCAWTSRRAGWTAAPRPRSRRSSLARADAGVAILVATHDPEFAAAVATRAILLADGQIVADAAAPELLSGGWYFATETARILGGHRGILTAAQAVRELTGVRGAAVSWQLASFALLGAALAAGFGWYERSKPSSRTVALVATLAALATLGRIAFAPLPNVKPTTDIVLIAGYVLGGAPGFTVGAVSAIASNVVFSEGPWTPWQMLAWGLVGVAGWLLSLRGGPRRRIAMAIACGLAGFGYGFVVDLYTWLGYSQHTFGQYLAVESASFPFNLAHAAGNVVFYLAFGPALVRALRRFRERFTVRWLPAGTPSALLLAGLLAVGVAVPLWQAGTARAARGRDRSPTSSRPSAPTADGGWGRGEPSSAESTGWVVIGLAAAHAPAATIARGAEWIRTHEGQIQTPGDLERTILALAAARAPLGNLVERLDRRRAANGSFDGQANWTAFAILAQRAAGAPIDGERAWLERQQNADGGFGFAQRGDPSDIDDTAGAIEALVAAGAPVRACDALPPARREPRRRLPARAGRGLERAVDRVGGAGAGGRRARPPRGRCAGSRRASPPPARSTTRPGMRRRPCG